MKKEHFQLLSLILVLAVLLQPFASYATEKTSEELLYTDHVNLIQAGAFLRAQTDSGTSHKLRSAADDDTNIRNTIYSGLFWAQKKIDVSQYQLSPDEFHNIIQDILNTSPELFYVGASYSYSPSRTGNYVSACFPQYKLGERELTASDIEEMREEFDDTANRILSTVNPAWSDREKALYIHDYLASQCEYDTRTPTSVTDPCRYDAYSLIVEGKAVCQGYSLAYLYFMKRLGIPCATVPSDSMVHMWNQIQLDGKWYHVDITYDDPLNDIPGRAMHLYFLLSDTAISSNTATRNAHYGWDKSTTCQDTTYDTYFWLNSIAPFVNYGDSWFYINSLKNYAGIYEWNPLLDETAELAEKKVDLNGYRWPAANAGASYPEKYSGLAIHDGIIYFNTPDEIRYFPADIEGEVTTEKLFGDDTDSPISLSGYLFGLRIKNNVLEYADGSSIMSGTSSVIVTAPAKSAYTFETPDSTYAPPAALTPPPTPSADPETSPNVSATKTPPPSGTTTDSPEGTDTPDVTNSPGNTGNTGNTSNTGNAGNTGNTGTSPAVNNNTNSVISPGTQNTTSTPSVSSGDDSAAESQKILSAIKITAKKGKRSLSIRVPKKTKTVISINKKILLDKKKTCKKLTVSASQNKSGKITVKLSSKLKKNMKISVTVSVAGKQYKKTVRV